MNAFQIFWTYPIYQKIKNKSNRINDDEFIENLLTDFYFLTMVLSALQWKKLHNSKIKLYTDSLMMNFLNKYELTSIWDEYDCETFTKIDKSIDLNTFWSVGKFYAYLNEKAPCIAIDVDLILWENINSFFNQLKVGFTHWEDTSPSKYYVSEEIINKLTNSNIKQNLDWNLPAANTSIVYWGDDNFKNYYSTEVINYMKNNLIKDKSLIGEAELLFIEQRLLIMLAKEKNITNNIKPLLNLTWSPTNSFFYDSEEKIFNWQYYLINNNSPITHLWIEKDSIANNSILRKKICYNLLDLIAKIDFSLINKLHKIDFLKKYM